jgi:outer membrane beta-barrel protein
MEDVIVNTDRKMRMALVALAAVFALPVAAGAQQVDREAVGPSREVVQERLYVFDGRFDISLMGGLSMNNKLIDHYAFLLQPAYHITDAWAIELIGGYILAQERNNLTNRAQDAIRISIHGDPTLDNEFADMGQMQWAAQAAIRWSPIYGKLNLAAELPVHFGAYASVGGGVLGVRRVSLADCQTVVRRDDGYVDYVCNTTEGVQPSVTGALGLRFYMADWLAFRAELKNLIFPDEYRLAFRTEPRTVQGLTSVLMFIGGVSFYF